MLFELPICDACEIDERLCCCFGKETNRKLVKSPNSDNRLINGQWEERIMNQIEKIEKNENTVA
jgi:hypothetical protein